MQLVPIAKPKGIANSDKQFHVRSIPYVKQNESFICFQIFQLVITGQLDIISNSITLITSLKVFL